MLKKCKKYITNCRAEPFILVMAISSFHKTTKKKKKNWRSWISMLEICNQSLLCHHFTHQNIEFYENKMCNLGISKSGLCRGCVLGTFSTLKSGMSPIILVVGAHVPTNFRFTNGNITKVTPESYQCPHIFQWYGSFVPHFSKALAEHC